MGKAEIGEEVEALRGFCMTLVALDGLIVSDECRFACSKSKLVESGLLLQRRCLPQFEDIFRMGLRTF